MRASSEEQQHLILGGELIEISLLNPCPSRFCEDVKHRNPSSDISHTNGLRNGVGDKEAAQHQEWEVQVQFSAFLSPWAEACVLWIFRMKRTVQMQRNIIIITFGLEIFLANVILIRATVKGEKANRLKQKLVLMFSDLMFPHLSCWIFHSLWSRLLG